MDGNLDFVSSVEGLSSCSRYFSVKEPPVQIAKGDFVVAASAAGSCGVRYGGV